MRSAYKLKFTILSLVLGISISFFIPESALAKIINLPGSIYNGYDVTVSSPQYLKPGELAGANNCPIDCGAVAQCANSENIGNCGLPTCQGGNAWSKYDFTSCTITAVDDQTQTVLCQPQYSLGDVVYSIGDKCFAPESGLHSSSCFGQPSPQQYKTCCSFGTPSFVNPGSCVDFAGDNTNPPWEGECPAGYRREVFCGPGYGVPCGQAACGPTGPICGNNSCEAGEDVNSCRADCLQPPGLNPFSGSCSGNTYTANLSWSCSGNCAPLPSTDSSCPNGYWVDISTSSSFSTYSNKCVTGTSTTAPSGFGGPGGAFTFQPDTTYSTRVYNGEHSNTLSLQATSCVAPVALPVTIGGKVTNCASSAAISGVSIDIYDNNLSLTKTTTTDFPKYGIIMSNKRRVNYGQDS